jgi:hypothetical protein
VIPHQYFSKMHGSLRRIRVAATWSGTMDGDNDKPIRVFILVYFSKPGTVRKVGLAIGGKNYRGT